MPNIIPNKLPPEWQLVALAIAAVGIFATRMTDLPIRGEETRRAEVASEMLATGDWVVPRQQMAPFLSRPPLGSYPIAALMWVSGGNDLWTVRLPSVVASVLTTLLVYLYARQFLSPLGALSAGIAYATMGLILQLGRLAESEALFTLLLGAALLIWHWGYQSQWRGAWAWTAGYSLAALAALVKGPQAPVYFIASTALYLIVQGRWKELITRRHFLGVVSMALIIGVWQIPFSLRLGWAATKAIWTGDVALRFEDTHAETIVQHLVMYPVGVLVATLPWSPLFSAYAFPSFRKSIAELSPWVRFLAIAVTVSAATCWLTPGAKERYMMPVFPCLAVLVGVVLDKSLDGAASVARRGWRVFATGLGGGMLIVGVGTTAIACGAAPALHGLLDPTIAWPLLAVAVVCGGLLIYCGLSDWSRRGYGLALGVAAFAGVFYVGVVIEGAVRLSEHAAPAVARLKQKLPKDARLVSFGLVETLFTYYYQAPVELSDWPTTASSSTPSSSPPGEYFCFTWDKPEQPDLPFAWTTVDEICCDRQHLSQPLKRVIVGRRLDTAVASTGPRRRDDKVEPAAFASETPTPPSGVNKPKRMFDPALRPASFADPAGK